MNTKKNFSVILLFFIFSHIPVSKADQNIRNKTNQIIIQLKNDVSVKSNNGTIVFPEDVIAINNKFGVVSVKPIFSYIPDIKTIKTKYLQRTMRVANTSFEEKQYNFKNFFLLSFQENTDINAAITNYTNNSNISSAEPNQIIHLHFYPENSDKNSTDYSKLINAENIQRISLGSPHIIAAVMDSGIATSHPSIFNRLWINKKEKINGIDDDSNGFIDDINGYNFKNFSNDITDHNGHGTFIAGLIGALPIDNTNIQGMNRYSPIMPVKIASKEGTTDISIFTQGLFYAINNGADIINISFDIKAENSVLLSSMLDYVYETGGVIILSESLSDPPMPFTNYKNIISVARYKTNTEKNADISAPDNLITSLNLKPTDSKNNYITSSNSFACTALVSSTVSLMLSVNAGLYVDEIKNIVKNTSVTTDGKLPLLNSKDALNEASTTRDQLINDLLSPTLDVQQTSLKKITIRGDSLTTLLIEQSKKEKKSFGNNGILIHSLGEIKSRSALPYLIEQLQNTDNNYLKRNIIEAIGKIGDPDTLDLLIEASKDSNAGIRYKTAIALGRLGLKDAGPVLMDNLNDPEERVVTESIESLTKIRYKKAIPQFTEQINDIHTNQFAKDQMTYAIGELGDKSALSALNLYKNNLLSGEPANNIVKYKRDESIKIVNEAIEKIESRDE